MISHKHKFIFVQINKTGNTSIRKTLCPETGRENEHRAISYYAQQYPKVFDEYFKFTFVRNPWDKVVSQYEFRRDPARFPANNTSNMSFEQFINNPNGRPLQNQLDWVTINQIIAVDWIGKFEYLQDDYNELCDILGVKRKILEHYNKTERRPYREYYNDKTRDIVAQIFSRDIDYFGYRF